jgi:hypothetical protein
MMLLGNTIQSDIHELKAGVYLAVDVGSIHRKPVIEKHYLVRVVGDSPFLKIDRIVAIPGLLEVKPCDEDTRDLKIVQSIYEDISGLLI